MGGAILSFSIHNAIIDDNGLPGMGKWSWVPRANIRFVALVPVGPQISLSNQYQCHACRQVVQEAAEDQARVCVCTARGEPLGGSGDPGRQLGVSG